MSCAFQISSQYWVPLSLQPLPKTWVNVVNGIGSFTDLVLTTIGTIDLFGGRE